MTAPSPYEVPPRELLAAEAEMYRRRALARYQDAPSVQYARRRQLAEKETDHA